MPASRILLLLSLALPLASTAEEPPPPWPLLTPATSAAPLPDTALLDWEGDLAATMVEGAHRFLDRHIASSQKRRDAAWSPITPDSLAEKRARFRLMIGLRDAPAEAPTFEFFGKSPHPLPAAEPRPVRWPAFADVTGTGYLYPSNAEPAADVILLGDPADKSFLPLLADLTARNFRVLTPVTIPRHHTTRGLPTREWLYRPAFEFGRHLAGYEIQKILAATHALRASQPQPKPLGIIGSGRDFGQLALFAAAAAEPETFTACLSGGFFRPLEDTWRGPADHNFFALLEEFGAAEIAALTAPTNLILHDCPAPEIEVPTGGKAKPTVPGDPPTPASIKAEFDRFSNLHKAASLPLFTSQKPDDPAPLEAFATALAGQPSDPGKQTASPAPPDFSHLIASQIHEIDRHTQTLISSSRKTRAAFMADLDFSSPGAFAKSAAPYRRHFAEKTIGTFHDDLLPPNPRSRPFQIGPHTTSYEVVLDVFPDLFACGILTLPNGIKPGEKRPVVVCQHGLEGRPQSTVGEPDFHAYKAFATRLAERGFITFAPQNLYTGKDRFRLLQFKANSLGKTLFSLMVPQHQQIVSWLGSLPQVDPARIAFYGLSYGGKSAMRIPPLVPEYCLSICSADFNEWVWKNTATDSDYSYVDKNEYEIFEWDLGSTFNYAEMATLIAPRPFMVERGHFDGVAPDDMVAFEFAKVRHLYQAKLGIGDRAEIAWFAGPHTIDGKATYAFLHRHLRWPEP